MSMLMTGMAILAGKAFGGGVVGTAVGAVAQGALVKGLEAVGNAVDKSINDKKNKK